MAGEITCHGRSESGMGIRFGKQWLMLPAESCACKTNFAVVGYPANLTQPTFTVVDVWITLTFSEKTELVQ